MNNSLLRSPSAAPFWMKRWLLQRAVVFDCGQFWGVLSGYAEGLEHLEREAVFRVKQVSGLGAAIEDPTGILTAHIDGYSVLLEISQKDTQPLFVVPYLLNRCIEDKSDAGAGCVRGGTGSGIKQKGMGLDERVLPQGLKREVTLIDIDEHQLSGNDILFTPILVFELTDTNRFSLLNMLRDLLRCQAGWLPSLVEGGCALRE